MHYSFQRIQLLKTAYASVDDVELVPGILLETPFNSETQFGGVTVCILAHCIKEWMVHDVRWINRADNPRHFTPGKVLPNKNRILLTISSLFLG
jgi:hypothetical protein